MILSRLLPDVGLERNPSRSKPIETGDPLQNVTAVSQMGSQAFRTAVEMPILIVSLAFLYETTWLDNHSDRTWGFADLAMIVLLSWFIKRAAASNGVIS